MEKLEELFYLYMICNENDYLKNDGIKILKTQNKWEKQVYFEASERFGVVSIWNNHVVEQQVYSKKDGCTLFYLHYELVSMQQFRSLFKDFYKNLKEKVPPKPYKALILCSGGLSSSLYATRLETLAKLKQYPIQIDACALMYFDDVFNKYDVILLAPQVSHKQIEIMNKVNHEIPIYRIPATVYGTMSLDATLDLLVSLAKKKNIIE